MYECMLCPWVDWINWQRGPANIYLMAAASVLIFQLIGYAPAA